jgi:hypothetical protein
MLPALPQAFGNLKDVFRSAYDSLSGGANPLNLPRVKNSLVIMVDGLGWENLNQFSGHAPFIRKCMQKDAKGYSGFPSTTAASIVSLATGKSPSIHGIMGYRVFDREKSESVNLLTGLTAETVKHYLRSDPIISNNEQLVVVSRTEYEDSGFSMATFPGAKFLGAASISQRFNLALNELNSGSGKLIYLYIPELDQAAHRFGSNSDKWTQLLEQVDAELKQLHESAAKNRGIILTADHGVIDVPAHGRVYLDECDAIKDSLLDVGGDPRATFLYFKDGVDQVRARSELSEWLDGAAQVFDMTELVAAGLYDQEVLLLENIAPDLVVLAETRRVCYHRGFAKPASLNMIGQHGGLTAAEITVPILKLGDYSSSLLVP